MHPGPSRLSPRALALTLVFVLGSGCGLQPRTAFMANRPPEITLDRPTWIGSGDSRVLLTSWKANDPDGRVDHCVYAIDPHSIERVGTSWIRTMQSRATVTFPHSVAIGRAGVLAGSAAPERHVFAVRAVDERGALSPVAVIAVVGDNIAPSVFIENPTPNGVFTTITPTSLQISWRGQDADGQVVRYKYRLFRQGGGFTTDPDINWAISHPDSFRDLFAPGFPGWDSVGGETTFVRYAHLPPDQLYLFAVTAIDDKGDYDPVFSADKNMLRFVTTENGEPHPQFCVSGPFFSYCAPDGRDFELQYEIPDDGEGFPVNWIARPVEGSEVTGYRWVLDPTDTTALMNHDRPTSDPNHWTQWSPSITSTTIGPFPRRSGPLEHVLYVQAKDTFDRISTFRIDFFVVRPTFAREVLIVDDTRLSPDQLDTFTGALSPPRGTWPSAAELDTFFYARGGFPWRSYPSGTTTTPGIFAGYDFDTLGTRGIAGGIVPLSLLSQYRQVVWITDGVGATYTGAPTEPAAPTTSLRLMSSPGQMSTLSAYGSEGGKLWVMGGGVAYATLASWGRPNTPFDDWTNADGELVHGRFMYDFPHWQSAVGVRPARQAILNIPDWAPPGWTSSPTVGRGWSAQGPNHDLSQPNYGSLVSGAGVQMQVLAPRTCATDPPPPQRFCNAFYLLTNYPAEFIGRPLLSSPPNFIVENAEPRPNHEREESTLDTLYAAIGGTMPGPLPVMTYYHGFESAPVVFSGFPVWYFQRAQCQKLVDFVLQDIWGLPKSSSATSAALASRRRTH